VIARPRKVKVLRNMLAGAALIVVLTAAAFAGIGPARIWNMFGDADLGPVSFAALERRTTGNDALACPLGVCTAPADVTATLYAVPAAELRRIFGERIMKEPRVTQVARDDAAMADRYIQRSRVMGFPDTIVVQYFDRPNGQSTLAISSRSRFGKGDMGVNRARVARWLALLNRAVTAP
jgi:uncharacterized protein (DUF1499 family)